LGQEILTWHGESFALGLVCGVVSLMIWKAMIFFPSSPHKNLPVSDQKLPCPITQARGKMNHDSLSITHKMPFQFFIVPQLLSRSK